MAKAINRLCKYKYCQHEGKRITGNDEFVASGNSYYHKDCFQSKEDVQYIKNLWISHISQTVSIPLLYKVIYEYIERGVSSEYLVFVLEYVVKNHCKLNYPLGFKYYIDDPEIKKKFDSQKIGKIPAESFVAVEPQEEPQKKSYSLPKRASGFASILGGE